MDGSGRLAGFVIGVISKSVSSVGISQSLRHALSELGAGSALTPTAYIGFSFSFFVVAVSALGVSQVAAARHEELEERLETILALPVSRRRWLGGRLVLGCLAVAAVALAAGAFTWLGAVTQDVSLLVGEDARGRSQLPAGGDPVPGRSRRSPTRSSRARARASPTACWSWRTSGSCSAPCSARRSWLVNATPFAHIGLVPAGSLRWGAAGVMLAIGLLAGTGALELFARRDLSGA